MNTHLPTHTDMMVIIKALIAELGDEVAPIKGSTQSYAKTQDVIVMALAYLGKKDIRTVVKSLETKPLEIDLVTLKLHLPDMDDDDNIYKYFDDLYTSTHGKSSKAAFEQADETILATSRELTKAYQKP